MSDLLKRIIIDNQEGWDQPSNERLLNVDLIPGKPVAIIGVRRCGKSTFLTQVMRRLSGEGVPTESFVSINFVDERIRPLETKVLSDLEESYFELFPENHRGLRYWFLDEIQLVPDWEYFVDRLARDKRNIVLVTGSSAEMLSADMASALRGRALVYELFPYSFPELLVHQNLVGAKPSSQSIRKKKNLFNLLLEQGGFPEVWDKSQQQRIQILGEYYRSILTRDVIERHNPRDSYSVEICMKHLTSYLGRSLSLNKLSNNLKAQGVKISPGHISEILQWLVDAFFLFTVPLFTESEQKRRVNPIKIYGIDGGLVMAVNAQFSANSGHILENAIYLHLRRTTRNIFYYKSHQGYEVDFVVADTKTPQLVQVCDDFDDLETRTREIRAITGAMEELGVRTGAIVTRSQSEVIKIDSGVIQVIPAHEFCGV